jgi:putative DNA methylase
VKTAGKGRKPPKEAKEGTKLARGANFRCILSGTTIEPDYIKAEGMAGRMSARLMAVVAEGTRTRIYLAPMDEMEAVARTAKPGWKPEGELVKDARAFTPILYGISTWSDLFTSRQLVALTTFSDLVQEARKKVWASALVTGWPDDERGLEDGGLGATAYSEAVSVYLAFALSKQADLGNNLCRWEPIAQCPRQLFARQAIPMVWDFAEGNPLGNSSGSWSVLVEGISKAFSAAFEHIPAGANGSASQADACGLHLAITKTISTDPPYYDNIPYADLSDFFYGWMRRSLKAVFPGLFSTIAVPKDEELVATPYRHGGKEKAEAFFMGGMTLAMQRIAELQHPAIPITIYYAFKQSDTDDSQGSASTGWETFLGAVMQSNLTIYGTWPLRTENASRMRGMSSNALASSIVLVCRRRDESRAPISRREFLHELKVALPNALQTMIEGAEHQSPIAPVDLAQAAIGPGMAVFSRYPAILEADGAAMTVHTALTLINKEVDEYLNRGLESVDIDTRFCMDWFAEFGWKPGPFGQADVLARARDLSIDHLERSQVLKASEGKVWLTPLKEYPDEWLPGDQGNASVWESLHQLIKAFHRSGGVGAARLLALMQERESGMRQLAYLLYTLCERKGWAEEARAYNELIAGWQDLERIAPAGAPRRRKGMELFDQEKEQS